MCMGVCVCVWGGGGYVCVCVCVCVFVFIFFNLHVLVYTILWFNYNVMDVVNVDSDATNEFLPKDNEDSLN